MRYWRKIGWISLQNIVGLVVIIFLVIGVSFLPTVMHVRVGEVAPTYGATMFPVQLMKEWKVLPGSAVYLTAKTDDEDVNYKLDQVSGYWDMNPEKPDTMQAEMKVGMQSLNSGLSLRDQAVKSRDLLDVADYQTATFQLKSFGQWPDRWQQTVPTDLIMYGVLTFKGVQKPIKFNCNAQYDQGTWHLDGKSEVQLSDFKIQNPHPILFKTNDQVTITLQILLGEQDESHYVAPGEKPTLTDFARPDDCLTSYNVNLDIDTDQKRATGSMQVTTRNNASVPLDRIYFHLYENYFRDPKKLTGADNQTLLGTDPKPGSIDIRHVFVNGQSVDFSVNNTILQIPLHDWQPGQTITVSMDFQIQVPKTNDRSTYNDNILWLGNTLPIEAVYDENGWNLDPYAPIGDPFYSVTSNYALHVTVPDGWKLASSGVDQRVAEQNGKTTYAIAAHQVRDVALAVMNNHYDVATETVDGVRVNTWYSLYCDPVEAQKMLDAAVASLHFYDQHFGQYPYKEYDVVQTGGFYGGMEYPGMVFITDAYFRYPIPDAGADVVAHETAHQWWYGMVGDNEVKNPWLDESLTEYSTMRFMESYDPAYFKTDLAKRQSIVAGLPPVSQSHRDVGDAITKFPSDIDYSHWIYTKGSLMYYNLGKSIGNAKMDAALQHYFQTYQYKVTRPADLEHAFADVVGPGVVPYLKTWLHGDTTVYHASAR